MKTLIDYIVAILKIGGCILAYALASYLLGLIHPVLPGLVVLVLVVGFVAHVMVDIKRMNAKSAESTAAFEASMAKLRTSYTEPDVDVEDPDAEFKAWRDARTQAWFETMAAEADRRLRAEFEAERVTREFQVEGDHTQASDAEDDDAPLTRYSENDPVQRA